VDKLEQVWWESTRVVMVLEHLCCEERPRELPLAWSRDTELRLSNTSREVIEKMEPGS